MENLNKDTYLITPSLLNSWLWIWNCEDSVRENENDSICLEDKQEDARNKAFDDFIKTLNREEFEPNQYMLEGLKFEDETYKGKTCFSEIVKDGAFQIVGKKEVEVDGLNFLMYGRLDVLKGGVIYDIKRVWRYTRPKYRKSSQHGFYLDLFENAKKFTYLIWDGNNPHYETYYRDETIPTIEMIHLFIKWLKENGLLGLYKKNWKCKIY